MEFCGLFQSCFNLCCTGSNMAVTARKGTSYQSCVVVSKGTLEVSHPKKGLVVCGEPLGTPFLGFVVSGKIAVQVGSGEGERKLCVMIGGGGGVDPHPVATQNSWTCINIPCD